MMTEKEMQNKCIKLEKKLYELAKAEKYNFDAISDVAELVLTTASEDKKLVQDECTAAKIALKTFDADDFINDKIINIVKRNKVYFSSLKYDEHITGLIKTEIKLRRRFIDQLFKDNDIMKYHENTLRFCPFTTMAVVIIIGQKMEGQGII